jgi:hypothetical protein
MRLGKTSSPGIRSLRPWTKQNYRPKLSIGAVLIVLSVAIAWVGSAPVSTVPVLANSDNSPRDVPSNIRLARSDGRHFRVPRSIDPTGGRDVAAALTRFIRSVPNDSTITFPHNARYRIDGQVTVRRASGLVIDGNGSTFFRVVDGSSKRLRLWLFELVRDSVFRDAKIVGLNRAGHNDWDRVYEHGIALYGDRDFTVADVRVLRTWGDGLVIQHADRVTPTSSTRVYPNNVMVRDSYFKRNGRAGISIITGTDISIVHNRVLNAAINLVNLEPDADEQVIDGVDIRNNTFDISSEHGGLMVASSGTCQVNNVTISGNKQVGYHSTLAIWSKPFDRPTCTVRSTGWRIVNNEFLAVGGGVNPYVIRFDTRDDVTIQGNSFHFSFASPGYEIGLFDVHGGTVSDNTKSGPGAGSQQELFVDSNSQDIWLNGNPVA